MRQNHEESTPLASSKIRVIGTLESLLANNGRNVGGLGLLDAVSGNRLRRGRAESQK